RRRVRRRRSPRRTGRPTRVRPGSAACPGGGGCSWQNPRGKEGYRGDSGALSTNPVGKHNILCSPRRLLPRTRRCHPCHRMPAAMTDRNPLTTYAGLPPFSAIRAEHVEPAVDALIAHNRARIADVLATGGPYTWETLVA